MPDLEFTKYETVENKEFVPKLMANESDCVLTASLACIIATSDDEQAVSIETQFPVSPKKYDTRPAAALGAVPTPTNCIRNEEGLLELEPIETQRRNLAGRFRNHIFFATQRKVFIRQPWRPGPPQARRLVFASVPGGEQQAHRHECPRRAYTASRSRRAARRFG